MIRFFWVALALSLSNSALASVSAAEAAQLGQKLTPVGAEKAGGAAAAGVQVKPAQKSAMADDDFLDEQDAPTRVPVWNAPGAEAAVSNEKPLFTINAVNLNRYRENLTESHFSLLQTNPNTYFLNVYAPRRPVRWPKEIEAATRENATRCSLQGTDDLSGCRLGFPFPIPHSGAEVIWNHKLRWRGDAVSRYNEQLVVQSDGKFQVTRLAEDIDARYANIKDGWPLDAEHHEFLRFLSQTLEPPRLAGNFVLFHDNAGVGTSARTAWALSPKAMRPRREPKICCDNPYEGSDGLQFFDQVDMYNGALDRYAWKLLGKREVFIPYNADRLNAASAHPADLVRPTHLNQELLRYELHRVWVVEATLKPGMAHTLRKRRFYVDEDSWSIVAVDMLDTYDQPYQFQEGHLLYSSANQRSTYAAEVIYHLNTGRYFVTGLRGDQPPPPNSGVFPPGHFEPDSLIKLAAEAGTHASGR